MIFLRSVYCKAPRENFPPPFASFCMPFARHVETSRAKQKPAQGEAAKNRDIIDFTPRIPDSLTTIFNISRKTRPLSTALQLDSTERGITLRSAHFPPAYFSENTAAFASNSAAFVHNPTRFSLLVRACTRTQRVSVFCLHPSPLKISHSETNTCGEDLGEDSPSPRQEKPSPSGGVFRDGIGTFCAPLLDVFAGEGKSSFCLHTYHTVRQILITKR